MIERVKWISSLEKVFPDKEPGLRAGDGAVSLGREAAGLSGTALSVPEAVPCFLEGEVFSLQCAFLTGRDAEGWAEVTISGPFAEYAAVREVCPVPCRFAGTALADGQEQVYAPGLYPDLLKELRDNRIRLYPGQWQGLWITIKCGGQESGRELPVGIHELELTLTPDQGEPVKESLKLELMPAGLPEQKLIHTEWFHTDCLADYYRVEPWSEAHWSIVEKFLMHYGAMGMNMVLVPVFTPPLDTAVGRERTTVQLVDVWEEDGGSWSFGFERVERYVELCRQAGIRYLEIAHLFTQWGARCAPKVMVRRGGVQVRRFGWDTASDSPEYLGFLEQFLKAFTGKLSQWGYEGRAFFHLSDEPGGEETLKRYGFLREKVTGWIAPYPLMDALSDYSFYETGAVDYAVPSMNSLPLFAEKGASPLWTYYCGAHSEGTPNRYIAMPASQVRVLGVLLYVYQVEGFLHWGYNFYNSQYSLEHIDPYAVTDAGGAFPSGDSYLVYPGEGGRPEDSQRMLLMLEAMQDLRALQLLESLWGRDRVLELIRSEAGEELTAKRWPRDPGFLLRLREKVNRAVSV
ncbi:MAG: DUF4091 domain-containing protein [Acetatifactor sp.]|nr:DUF4091 domain-containing protein [Acetatifactor sp.]